MGRSGGINTSLASSVSRASTYYTLHTPDTADQWEKSVETHNTGAVGQVFFLIKFTSSPDWSDWVTSAGLSKNCSSLPCAECGWYAGSWWLRLRCRHWVSWRSKMFHRIYGTQLEFRHTPIKALNTDFYLSKRFLLSFYYIPNLQFNISWKVYCLYCR